MITTLFSNLIKSGLGLKIIFGPDFEFFSSEPVHTGGMKISFEQGYTDMLDELSCLKGDLFPEINYNFKKRSKDQYLHRLYKNSFKTDKINDILYKYLDTKY